MSTASRRDRTAPDRGSGSRPARVGGYEPRRKKQGNNRRSTSQDSRGRNGRRSSTTAATMPPARGYSPLESALQASAAVDVSARNFGQLGLPSALVGALAGAGISDPTDVQLRTIPDGLAGRDILGRAQTGSGKTLAFGLPLIATLAARREQRRARHPKALILTPTRELAQQVADSLAPIAASVSLEVLPVFGGAPMGRQTQGLTAGREIVVATPGRLEDHIRRGTIHLDDVAVFALDEADHMADLGFLPSVTAIMERLPRSAQRMLFSATLDRGVERLANDQLSDPAVHAARAATASVDTMEHRSFGVTSDDKFAVAARIAARHGRTLVFVRTKHGADRLARRFAEHGLRTEAIHGNRSQAQRQRALAEFDAGRRPVLVATDVAARGIHVDDVDLVLHFDPPADHKDYLHRSGRTARAGKKGMVVSLVLPHERKRHQSLVTELAQPPRLVGVDAESPLVAELAASGTPVEVRSRPKPAMPGGEPRRAPRRPRHPRGRRAA